MKTFNQVIHDCLYKSCSTEWVESLEEENVAIAVADLPKSKFTNQKVLPILVPSLKKPYGIDIQKHTKEQACLFPTDYRRPEKEKSTDGNLKYIMIKLLTRIDWSHEIVELKNRILALRKGWEDQVDKDAVSESESGATTGISRRTAFEGDPYEILVPAKIALPESILYGYFHKIKLAQKGIEKIDEKLRLMKNLDSLSLTGNEISKIDQKNVPRNLKSFYLDGNM